MPTEFEWIISEDSEVTIIFQNLGWQFKNDVTSTNHDTIIQIMNHEDVIKKLKKKTNKKLT